MFKKVMKLHFVGIGGSGMCGIAEVLLNGGYPITGSDRRASEATKRLQSLGAKVFEGHQASNVGDAEAVIVSNAVPETNPEILEARRRKIPVIPRAQMLNEIMRLKYGVCISGTHGKTTTTSMTGLVLKEGGYDPTIVIGGVLDAVGSNALLGKGDYFVVEADEAFASFLQLSPAICVVTNIDNDHLDHYKNMDNLRDAFVRFINKLPFYGFALVCGDDAEIQGILPRVVRRVVTYGFKETNDLQVKIESSRGLSSSFGLYRKGQKLGSAVLSKPGQHNILNAVAAIGVGMELGMCFEACAKGLANFSGVRRRFQVKGEAGSITVVDDYAHHPTELDATLKAARDTLRGKQGRLIVAFQPHLFSRTQMLYKEFAAVLEQAEEVYLCGIYPARETPIPGVTSQLIVDLLEAKGKNVTYRSDQNDLLPKVVESLREGDLFLTAGAGTIDALGDLVLGELKKRPVSA